MAIYTIAKIHENEWPEVSGLIAQGVPSALISKLGTKAGIVYYKNFVKHENSCGYVAKDELGIIAGTIIGAVEINESESILFKLRLIIAANVMLFRLSVISWLLSGVLMKIKGSKQQFANSPSAELLAIAVKPQAKGTGLAQQLVKKLEDFMVSKGFNGSYTICTEKNNIRANRFYKKIGAELIETYKFHGREINKFHKEISR